MSPKITYRCCQVCIYPKIISTSCLLRLGCFGPMQFTLDSSEISKIHVIRQKFFSIKLNLHHYYFLCHINSTLMKIQLTIKLNPNQSGSLRKKNWFMQKSFREKKYIQSVQFVRKRKFAKQKCQIKTTTKQQIISFFDTD